MSRNSEDATMMVSLTEGNVAGLIGLRTHPKEPLNSVVSRLIRHSVKTRLNILEQPSQTRPDDPVAICAGAKYVAEVLGKRISASTLGRLFGVIVDQIDDIDPSVLERLELMRARKRRYVARAKSSIHPGRPDLETLKSKSEWWVSANVGKEDVTRGLKALCHAGQLKFGSDIRFPVKD